MNSKIIIRKAKSLDGSRIWEIIREVISPGNTYTFHPHSSKEEMLDYWLADDKHTYVAEVDGIIEGTYILKNNQPGLGAHIANGSYMVHPKARGKGVGKAMGIHSIETAKQLGYTALQFNIVVKSNEPAIKLWQQLGFEIIGEIPDAFQHQQLGLTNAYIMFRKV